VSGCGQNNSTGTKQPEAVNRLRAIHSLYVQATSSLGKPPKTEQEFKAAIDKMPKEQLNALMAQASLQPGELANLLKSPRDQQPFVVKYGTATGAPAAAAAGPGGGPGLIGPGGAGGPGVEGPAVPPKPGQEAVLAYEAKGEGGKRYVLFVDDRVEEVDAAKAAELKLK